MVTYSTKWLHLIALAGLLVGAQAHAQPAGVEAVANYSGAEDSDFHFPLYFNQGEETKYERKL